MVISKVLSSFFVSFLGASPVIQPWSKRGWKPCTWGPKYKKVWGRTHLGDTGTLWDIVSVLYFLYFFVGVN